MSLAAYVAEDGLVGHQWEERPLVCKDYMPQYKQSCGYRQRGFLCLCYDKEFNASVKREKCWRQCVPEMFQLNYGKS